MKKKDLLLKILGNAEAAVAGVVMVALVLATFLGVFARYIFNKPFNWLEEMLMYAQREDVGAVGAKLFYPDGTQRKAVLHRVTGKRLRTSIRGIGKLINREFENVY